MEADWAVEIGVDAPIIDSAWACLVDLRLHPDRASQLPECIQLPALAKTLIHLNADMSAVWTSKCDVWTIVDTAGIDPDEYDAQADESEHAIGCYIDLLPRSNDQWADLDIVVAECKKTCATLRAASLRCCRVDLVIRRAVTASNRDDLGVTAYLTSCGTSNANASHTLEAVLEVFAHAFSGHSPVE
jgi:hypothetical protein